MADLCCRNSFAILVGLFGEIIRETRHDGFATPEKHALGVCGGQLRIGAAVKLMRGFDEFQSPCRPNYQIGSDCRGHNRTESVGSWSQRTEPRVGRGTNQLLTPKDSVILQRAPHV